MGLRGPIAKPIARVSTADHMEIPNVGMNWRDALAVWQRVGRAERTMDALETDRQQRAVTGERAEPWTVRRFRRCRDGRRAVADRVYGPEKAAGSAGSRDRPEDRAGDDDDDDDDDDDGDYGPGDEPRSRSDASVREKRPASESVAGSVGQAGGDDSAVADDCDYDDDDDDSGGSSGSRTAQELDWPEDEWWYADEAADEEADGESDGASSADAVSEPIAYADDRSEAERPSRLTDIETYEQAYSLEKHLDRMRVFEAMVGHDGGGKHDKCDDKCDDGGGRGPRNDEALALRTLVRTARDLRSCGTFESLPWLNAAESRKATEKSEKLQAEGSFNRVALEGLRTDDESMWHAEEKRLAKNNSLLSIQCESITSQIKIEDDYFQAKQQQHISEEKELLRVEVREHRKRTQDINDRYLTEDKYINEAKRIISSYAKTMDRHVDTWSEMYSRDMGVVDRDIMALELEEKLLYEEFLTKTDQLNARDEHKKNKHHIDENEDKNEEEDEDEDEEEDDDEDEDVFA